MKKTTFFSFIFLLPLFLFSQEKELGAWLGAAHYFGDLNTTTSFRHVRPAGGLIGRYNFSPFFAARASLDLGFVGFSDNPSKKKFQQKRNLSFTSIIVEASAQLEFNFFKFEFGNERYWNTPFIFGGFGVFYFNPKTSGAKLKRASTEGQGLVSYPDKKEYFLIQPTLLYGGGFKFRFKKSYWSWGIEAGNRHTFTDYLDDVSTTYPDKFSLASEKGADAVILSDRSLETGEEFGEAGRQRGDSKKKDSYFFAGFTLTYTFRNLKCPNPY